MAAPNPLSRPLRAVIAGRTYRIDTLADARLLFERMGRPSDHTWAMASIAVARAQLDPAHIPKATDAIDVAIRTERWVPFALNAPGAGCDEGQWTIELTFPRRTSAATLEAACSDTYARC